MSESKEVQYVVGKENTLLQLMKNFGRQKRVVVKYNEGFKYVHIYDNRKVVKKYPGITLGYDEFLQLYEIVQLMELADDYFKNVSIHT
jgi:hypothetical protein